MGPEEGDGMNDFEFGNRLYELRREAKLSQRELAKILGVTDKAVSKWENGRAKPTTDMLRNLSRVYGVPIEELLRLRESNRKPSITKIVITGGPCAGKSTAMTWIQNAFTDKGYRVLFVPETATELITAGVAPWTCRDNLSYQRCQLQLQLEKESVFVKAASGMTVDKILIVCDRGALDNKAYMTSIEFAQLLREVGISEVELRDGYDAIFHLVTAAKGAEVFYTTANNQARRETPAEAAALDDKLIAAWTGHQHLRIIDNTSDFENKMKRLIKEISAFLGEPEPMEIERKYLIEYPDIHKLEQLPNCRRIDIIQTYLTAPKDEERRVRQRGADGHYMYYETCKHAVTDLKRVETERRLSQGEYLRLLMEADPGKRPIRKTRYCLTEGGRYYEIDIYPFWTDRAIVEVELADEQEEVIIPRMFKVIREVTSDEGYRNATLATIGREQT